jgi:prolyl-tRNA editing enzyme YbaK/EbsC (Cys-tRNA(Pro) deacylase)
MKTDALGTSIEVEETLKQLKKILEQASVNYEVLGHAGNVLTAEEGVQQGMGSLAQMAPTLILETEKGCIAAIISGATRLSVKKIKKFLGLKNVSFAKPDVVLRETGAVIGSVSLVNPNLPTIIDLRLEKLPMVFGGCGVPHYTLRIRPVDLISLTHATVFDFSDPREQAS